jgi:hypothetical protein
MTAAGLICSRLLEEGAIVKRNFKPKSAIIDELVFDVKAVIPQVNHTDKWPRSILK